MLDSITLFCIAVHLLFIYFNSIEIHSNAVCNITFTFAVPCFQCQVTVGILT